MFKVLYGLEPYGTKYFIEKEIKALGFSDDDVIRGNLNDDILEDIYAASLFGRKYFILAANDLKNPMIEVLLKEEPENEVRVVVASLDKRLSITGRLEKLKKLKVFERLTGPELEKFILARLKDMKITRESFDYLVARTGYLTDENVSLFSIDTWLTQIRSAGRIVDRDLIDFYVPESKTEDGFKLFGYYAQGDAKGFFKLMMQLLENNESAISLLSVLLYNFRLAYKISLTGRSRAQFDLGLTPYQMKGIPDIPQATGLKAVSILTEGIRKLKNGSDAKNICIVTAARLFG